MSILHITIEEITINVIVKVSQDSDEVVARKEHVVTCPHCGWVKAYADEKSAKRGLSVHIARHCTGEPPRGDVIAHMKKIMGE